MYYQLLRPLFPRGKAWNIDSGVMKEIVQGKAEELARVDSRVDALQSERDTRTASELLVEHETEFGLPDGCIDPTAYSDADRRIALTTKLKSLGSMRKSYYIALAESLGYTGVTITEYTPFWCGLGVSGAPCGDQDILFYWLLSWTYDWTNPILDGQDIECMLNRYRPAHTVVKVAMTGPAFSNAFSNAFFAYPAVDITLGGAFTTAFDQAFKVDYNTVDYSLNGNHEFDAAFDISFDSNII